MARARAAFLDAGHFAGLSDLVGRRVAGPPGTLVIDAGGGTGHHLAAVLDRLPGAAGLALDLSKHAARRAARAHPRAAAAVVDLWRPVPVRTGAAGAILNVFAPRNGPEFRRMLRPDGRLYVVTPDPGHLATLREPLGLLSVDEHKAVRVAGALGEGFVLETQDGFESDLLLDHTEIETLVAMGPSARHIPAETLRDRLARLPAPTKVPIACTLSVYRPAV